MKMESRSSGAGLILVVGLLISGGDWASEAAAARAEGGWAVDVAGDTPFAAGHTAAGMELGLFQDASGPWILVVSAREGTETFETLGRIAIPIAESDETIVLTCGEHAGIDTRRCGKAAGSLLMFLTEGDVRLLTRSDSVKVTVANPDRYDVLSMVGSAAAVEQVRLANAAVTAPGGRD